MKKQIKLAIADDEQLILSLLEDYFNQKEEIDLVYIANGGQNLIQKIEKEESQIDVFLLDLKMGELDGVETAQLIKNNYPDAKVIIFSSHFNKALVGYMLKNNIDAFLPKGINPNELLQVIKTVNQKGYYLTQEQIGAIRTQISSKVPLPRFEADALSKREIEVLQAICRQFTAQEISEKLFISKSTVEGHKKNLLEKTGARNSAGLVIFAVKNNLFDPEELLF
tara:strand:+ start:2633 stop:3304 length:672 start_codon:yes stop_codon:yes gene_type:complete